jgi:succinate dehydrogenase / fumarate reductase cytochrome b subunit
LFLILHLANFWVHTRFTGDLSEVYYDNKPYEDLYALMKLTFSDLTIVVLYVLGCISLAYHLAHGFQSAFRTLGVHHKKYLVPIVVIGNVFAIVVPFVFAMMPISMYFGWV